MPKPGCGLESECGTERTPTCAFWAPPYFKSWIHPCSPHIFKDMVSSNKGWNIVNSYSRATVDPRLSGSRTEIIARAYNDLRMPVVAVDKKLLYTWLLNQLFCQLKIVRLLDKAVYHSAPLVARPVHSSWLFSPCSQQLALLALFTATGKRIWPIIHLSGLFTYPAWFSYYFGQRGPDNRGSTV